MAQWMASTEGIGEALIAEGLCPDNARNIELLIPADGAVAFRYEVFVEYSDLPKLARAFARAAASEASR